MVVGVSGNDVLNANLSLPFSCCTGGKRSSRGCCGVGGGVRGTDLLTVSGASVSLLVKASEVTSNSGDNFLKM